MTNDEELAWARAEHVARLADLQDRTPEGLTRAQKNAEVRRKAAGLSRSQAAALVHQAGVERRRNEMRTPAGVPATDNRTRPLTDPEQPWTPEHCKAYPRRASEEIEYLRGQLAARGVGGTDAA